MLCAKSRKFLALFLVLIIFFPAACCSRKEKEQELPKLRIRLENDPTTLDPAFIVDVTGGNIAAKIFNGLVKYDNSMKLIGDLAESYEISQDGKTYTFHLRKGVRFHCGRELRAEDVQFSFERVLNKKNRFSEDACFTKDKRLFFLGC